VNKKLIVILGPTASGKSEMAIKLAKKFNGEVVSADSRQVYKTMDIATAKPLQSQKYLVKGIPHHLIDIVYPDQEFNVAIYKQLAIKAIKDIQKRKKVPFLVGGTGLYIKAVVDNIEFPSVPPDLKLRQKLEKKSVQELFKIYKKLDREGAKFIDKDNKRRLIRAIEVSKITGKSFWRQRKKGKPLFNVLQIGIKLAKETLRARIIKRIQKMFKSGLEKESKNLIKKYGWIPTLQTIGYQEWSSFVRTSEDKKRIFFPLTKNEKEEVKNLIIQHTIQFAKRQMTWWKSDKRILWVKNYKKAEELVKEFLDK
jgi:tRNA dimethylallyltransferase